MGNELKWLLKEGDGCIFKSCDISLENMPTSHAVSLALVICACSDSAMPLLSRACLCNNSNGECLLLVVQHVLQHKWGGILSRGHTFEGGILSREKHPLNSIGALVHVCLHVASSVLLA